MDIDEERADLSPLNGAVVVLGITGGIAAYKAVEVCRRLVDAGAYVCPVMTESATRFVGTVTFSALASEPARTELFDDADPLPHTRLGRRADLVLVAPATANFLGEFACGLARDLLGSTVLATRAPVIVCPAMHTEMWEHPAVQDNLQTLVGRGVIVVPPESGRLAGGDEGPGRLADVETIVASAAKALSARRDLAGLRLLVTAGGTREPIDPVRFISNRSSGRQGHALAETAHRRGAIVTLVTASELAPPAGVEVIAVETAAELKDAVLSRADGADIVVMAAAVADFRPKQASST
ncbi:MAG TPA: bifunctional phosphopantothenoylcysteine decarboxylase/phosphopantothenate--cysteine ligase CoaBC, partial [Acidimicrobiales bacterium]|nr:bifunctional phosphopantothenoylcysteine decarboxylase/phosphopantothenate--cysteine ligase CoaBC [Acidimicrobiales bacterium]